MAFKSLEYLPRKLKALSSNLNNIKKKTTKENSVRQCQSFFSIKK
jgi:hypothetical protein